MPHKDPVAAREYRKKRYSENRERLLAYRKAYLEKNREEINANRREKTKSDDEYREKVNASNRERYAADKESYSIRNKRWREENPCKCKRIHDRKKEESPDAIKARGIAYKKSNAKYHLFFDRLNYAEDIRESDGCLEAACVYCGRWFSPTVNQCQSRAKALEGKIQGEHRLYCGESCKQACPIYRQRWYYKGNSIDNSSREIQPELRKMALERDGFSCKVCGDSRRQLHCHHIKPVGDEPIESADLDNVITLCVDCHHSAHAIPGCGTGEIGRC